MDGCCGVTNTPPDPCMAWLAKRDRGASVTSNDTSVAHTNGKVPVRPEENTAVDGRFTTHEGLIPPNCGNKQSPAVGIQHRLASLQRANRTRVERAALRQRLRRREECLMDLLADPPDYVLTAPIFVVLTWGPGIGPSAARKLLADAMGIARNDVSETLTVESISARTMRHVVGQLWCRHDRLVTA